MKINFEIIAHDQMRYETCGDWWLDDAGVIQVRVSRLSDKRYSALIFLHEMVELITEFSKRAAGDLDDNAALTQLVADTDAFDKEFEAARFVGDTTSEPGSEPDCPVYEGHMLANSVEHSAAMLMGVNYNDYADEVAALSKK